MEIVLKGIPKVIVYLDDTLISGGDEPEHLKILEQVLIRLDNAGLRVKKENMSFLHLPSHTLGTRSMPMAFTHFLRKLRQLKMPLVPRIFMN